MSITAIPNNLEATPRQKLWYWVPTLLWLCMLAAFSTDTFSAEHTGRILWKIVHVFLPGISSQHFDTLHFLVRKTAHFTSYGLLSFFAFFSWRATLPARERWIIRWCNLALLLTLLAASLDEFHQSFIPSRTSSVRDVMLDMLGAFFFQIMIAIFVRGK
ncbi:MAG TPA: VanZ family protein [Terriglobales bacterium]